MVRSGFFRRFLLLSPLLAAACGGGEGELTTAALERVVAERRPSLEPCYQRALDETPYKHEIRIEAVIEIEPTGRVASVELDQSGLAGMGPCLKQTIKSWTFPRARQATRTQLPLVFRPKVEPKVQ